MCCGREGQARGYTTSGDFSNVKTMNELVE